MKQIIAERYKIIDLIGQGGMADVYLAKDAILNRTVAIKVLRTNLAKDPIYVTRFQREASAAAALSHKNIVEIYDVGEDEGKYYIVMEYVPGVTLKELINRRGALHVVEAIDIMKQVVGGAARAHQLGIIHRDLKPQNILVTESGVAKIADFGIASMQSLAQVTQTDVIMGSLHYLAPELARGEKATCQSDIYALGIVLYELLRGEVPFHGESPVNIALKHMQEEIPQIREFNASIPQSVENVITKATAKNVKDRYENATAMFEDIRTCMNRLHEDKLVFTYNENTDPTLIVDPRDVFNGDITGQNKVVNKPTMSRQDAKVKKESILTKIQNLDLKFKIAIGVAIALVLSLGVYFAFFSGGSGNVKVMPDLENKTVEEAKVLLKDFEVTFDENVKKELSETIEKDKIISSNPKKGASVKKGDTIKLVISKGKYLVMEDYTGMTFERAKVELEELGYKVSKEEVESDKEDGIVLNQSIEKDEKIDPTDENKKITLTVSKVKSIVLSDYTGMTFEKAQAALKALNINVTIQRKDEVSEQAAGIVIGQSKDSGTVIKAGSSVTITLTVSKGISIEVPRVIGMNYNDARDALTNKGFIVDLVDLGTTVDASLKDKVISQSLKAFTTVDKKGVTIRLEYYSKVAAEPGAGEDAE